MDGRRNKQLQDNKYWIKKTQLITNYWHIKKQFKLKQLDKKNCDNMFNIISNIFF